MPAEVTFSEGLVRVVDHGVRDRTEAERTVSSIYEAIAAQGLPSGRVLVDARPAEVVARDARRVFIDMMADERIDRIGIVTQGTVMKVAVNLLARATGRVDRARVFTSLAGAEDWLRATPTSVGHERGEAE